jgi:hypothetical protein
MVVVAIMAATAEPCHSGRNGTSIELMWLAPAIWAVLLG